MPHSKGRAFISLRFFPLSPFPPHSLIVNCLLSLSRFSLLLLTITMSSPQKYVVLPHRVPQMKAKRHRCPNCLADVRSPTHIGACLIMSFEMKLPNNTTMLFERNRNNVFKCPFSSCKQDFVNSNDMVRIAFDLFVFKS